MKKNQISEEVCDRFLAAQKRPQTANETSIISPTAKLHKTFKSGRFFAGGPSRLGTGQNHTITNAQPDTGLKITSLSQKKRSIT